MATATRLDYRADLAPLAAERPHDLAAIYDEWFDVVHRWARALGGPSADAEDLAQEVFLVVGRKLAAFDGRNVASWLYAITARTVSDHRRRSWFRNLFQRRQDVELDELVGPHDLEASVERKREQARFYRLVARMSARWRDTFVLFEIAGYSGEELAQLTGLPHATVRTHLHRARKEFLALVAEGKRSVR